MASLSDKLSALGVDLGARKVAVPARRDHQDLESQTGAEFRETDHGRILVKEMRLPQDHRIGQAPLSPHVDLEILASWLDLPVLPGIPAEELVFLDTEASGLSTGAGTYITWFTAGRFIASEFQVSQIFLHDLAEEPAFLAALEGLLAPGRVVVTFNGKSFDGPLIQTRFASHQWPSPLENLIHIDLLHLARRIWRDRLPERRLVCLEEEILQLKREDDIPGYLVPEIYREYLQTGRLDRLEGVFRHNRDDVTALAALLYTMAEMLSDPLEKAEHVAEWFSIGCMYEEMGRSESAVRLLERCLLNSSDPDLQKKAIQRLSLLHKRSGQLGDAIELWKTAADLGEVYAHIELAKVYEHQHKELEQARRQTQAALSLLESPGFPLIERYRWKGELDHRLSRLNRKLGS